MAVGERAVGVAGREGEGRGVRVAALALAQALGAPLAVVAPLALALALGPPLALGALALGEALETRPPSSDGEAPPLAVWLGVEVGLRLTLGVPPLGGEALGASEGVAPPLALSDTVSDTHCVALSEAVAQALG